MRMLSINEDCASELFCSMLHEDYLGLKQQQRDLLAKESLQSFESEDLVNTQQVLVGMEILLGYYFTETQAAEIIAQN